MGGDQGSGTILVLVFTRFAGLQAAFLVALALFQLSLVCALFVLWRGGSVVYAQLIVQMSKIHRRVSNEMG